MKTTAQHAASGKADIAKQRAMHACGRSASHDDWTRDLVTRSGIGLHVRPACPEDEPLLATFFAHVTPRDLRFRFLCGIREVSHERLVAMTQVDHRLTESFLALVDGGKTVAGAAMLVCDAAMDTAEVAISVREGYKHQGVAWELLRHIARCAEAKGIRVLESIESRENHEAIELEREQGFIVGPYPDDATLVLIRKIFRDD